MENTVQQDAERVLIIGSGAAGLAARSHLVDALGVEGVRLYTEGLRCGTSINTGSDKQTYYKMGLYGAQGDCPAAMAADIAAGGAMHGDLAIVEAAMSVPAFSYLVSHGVPFPHDRFGQYIGYKTDHDPCRRATSCGPYTSREMCRALGASGDSLPGVYARRQAVQLLAVKDATGQLRCCGALFLDLTADEPRFETVLAANTVFAVGGPGGLYERSVYPAVHAGAIGVAMAAGAKCRNLPEFQYGIASIKFRWNVSGSYMQALPRFISCAADGVSDEREFLREYFPSSAAMYNMSFLKGYQWPFAAGHLPGSSQIDLWVEHEISVRGRRVFLDFRRDPADFDFSALNDEVRGYLEKSGAVAGSPLARLCQLNAPAVALYGEHGIDLGQEALEVAVCAQHNNGGLAGDVWWQSENIAGLFPVGEVNGSHGVTRPGGTALNSGQVGAWRASEYILANAGTLEEPLRRAAVGQAAHCVAGIEARRRHPAVLDWRQQRSVFRLRMSRMAAFVRREADLAEAQEAAIAQLHVLEADGLGGLSGADLGEALRNQQLLLAQCLYISAMLEQVRAGVGSRGGAVVQTADGGTVPEDPAFRRRILTTRMDASGRIVNEWEACRPVPVEDGWFENVWRTFREKQIFGQS